MKQLILVVATVFLVATAAGITKSEIPENPSQQEIQHYVDLYNNNTEKVPGYVAPIIGDQKINLYYENRSYGVEMKNLRIENVTGGFNDSTVEVWADRDDIYRVVNATNPRKELKTSLKNNEIRYEEKGIVNKLRFGVLRLFL